MILFISLTAMSLSILAGVHDCIATSRSTHVCVYNIYEADYLIQNDRRNWTKTLRETFTTPLNPRYISIHHPLGSIKQR